MRRPLLLAVLFLSGCDTPTRDYAHIAPVHVQIAQSRFDVRVAGDKAQAIRTNTEWAPRPQSVMPRAMAAIERASGCRVTRLLGDQVINEARLECGAGRPARPPDAFEFICDYRKLYRGHVEVVCHPGI